MHDSANESWERDELMERSRRANRSKARNVHGFKNWKLILFFQGLASLHWAWKRILKYNDELIMRGTRTMRQLTSQDWPYKHHIRVIIRIWFAVVSFFGADYHGKSTFYYRLIKATWIRSLDNMTYIRVLIQEQWKIL